MDREVVKEDLFVTQIKKATKAIQEGTDLSGYQSGDYLFKVTFKIEDSSVE